MFWWVYWFYLRLCNPNLLVCWSYPREREDNPLIFPNFQTLTAPIHHQGGKMQQSECPKFLDVPCSQLALSKDFRTHRKSSSIWGFNRSNVSPNDHRNLQPSMINLLCDWTFSIRMFRESKLPKSDCKSCKSENDQIVQRTNSHIRTHFECKIRLNKTQKSRKETQTKSEHFSKIFPGSYFHVWPRAQFLLSGPKNTLFKRWCVTPPSQCNRLIWIVKTISFLFYLIFYL